MEETWEENTSLPILIRSPGLKAQQQPPGGLLPLWADTITLPLENTPTPKNQPPPHLGLARLKLGLDQDDEVAVGPEDVGHRIQHFGHCGSDKVVS